MKNSIRTVLAMFAILPCALFFSACGGEKVEIAKAQPVYQEASTNTSEITTDYKVETNFKFSLKEERIGKTEGSVNGTIIKTGEVVDGNYDNVKLYVKSNATAKSSSANFETQGTLKKEEVIAKVDGKFCEIDKLSKKYKEVGESELKMGLMDALEDVGDSDISTVNPISFLDIDFSEITKENSTLKLNVEKFGDSKYVFTMEGYELMGKEGKIECKITIVSEAKKIVEMKFDVKSFTLKENGNPEKAEDFTEQAMSINGSMKVSYGKQKIDVPSLKDYKKSII